MIKKADVDIIKDLEERQKALKKQSKSLPKKDLDRENEIWEVEVNTKLDLVEELLGEYRK
jgi:hypothetical protein